MTSIAWMVIGFLCGLAAAVFLDGFAFCPRCQERAPLRRRVYECGCGETIVEPVGNDPDHGAA